MRQLRKSTPEIQLLMTISNKIIEQLYSVRYEMLLTLRAWCASMI